MIVVLNMITAGQRFVKVWNQAAAPPKALSDRRRSAARRAARIKPVIVLKPRRFPVEPDDAVYAAAFRRAGLLRVDDSDELLQMVKVLKAAKQVNNDRLAILSNSSSMSLLAADTL